MQKTHRSACAVIVVPAVLLLAACSSSTSSVTKLDETNAAGLIENHLKAEPYKVRLGPISNLFGRTLRDYKSSQSQNDFEATLKRLIDKGLVRQTAETVSYPVISGTFVGQGGWDRMYVGDTVEYRLRMIPASNQLTGEFKEESQSSAGRINYAVQGSVQPDGHIVLARAGSSECDRAGTYVEQGPVADLDLVPCPEGARAKWLGQATGKRVNVKWYQYSWTPGFQTKFENNKDGVYVAGGSFVVGHVTDLRLVTDTEAKAKFAWTTSLNETGRLFFPSQTPSGLGEASFGKKPDGTWFVDQLRVSDDGQARSASTAGAVEDAASLAATGGESSESQLARRAANQACAVGTLRTIDTAEVTFASTYPIGFSLDLAGLDGNCCPSTAYCAGLIDSQLASGVKCGYRFTYLPTLGGRVVTYWVYADPLEPGANHYFTDQSGVIRQNTERRAGPNDPPLAG